jgi:RimJ/RimL family protein N-acetyltransferase
VHLGAHNQLSDEQLADRIREFLDRPMLRQSVALRAAELVDGRGAQRVVRKMLCGSLTIRPARLEDAHQMFAWQQDPIVRQASFSAGPARWSEHLTWFTQRQADSNSLIFIGETPSGRPIGCIRFVREATRATISLVLDQGFRGRGLGTMLLRAGLECFGSRYSTTPIDAFIKPENLASRRTFAKAGFRFAAMESVASQPAERWVWQPVEIGATSDHLLRSDSAAPSWMSPTSAAPSSLIGNLRSTL